MGGIFVSAIECLEGDPSVCFCIELQCSFVALWGFDDIVHHGRLQNINFDRGILPLITENMLKNRFKDITSP